MLSRHKIAAFATVCALSLSAAHAEDVTSDTVVSTVNGKTITVGHLITARARLPQQYQSMEEAVLFQGLLDQLVRQELLAQTLGDDVPQRALITLENERRSLLAGEVIDGLMGQAVTDEAVQAAYDETYATQTAEKEFNASLEGGADFAELAKEKSTGPSGPNGGSLGWFGPGMMVKPFETAVMELEDGAVSAPVETQFGWHVVKLNESRIKAAPTLDEVREELVTGIQTKAVDEYLEGLMADATIDTIEADSIDPSVLSNYDLLPE
jgi:peptidyl-prolyl cis-trans isomerase C